MCEEGWITEVVGREGPKRMGKGWKRRIKEEQEAVYTYIYICMHIYNLYINILLYVHENT